MVAIRHSHELNHATFELAGWSESLHMSPVTFNKLQNAWQYSQEKLEPSQYELMWDGIEMAEILYGLNMMIVLLRQCFSHWLKVILLTLCKSKKISATTSKT